MKRLYAVLGILAIAIPVYVFADVGEMPHDLGGTKFAQPAFSGIFSANPGTKGTASVSATGKNGLYFNCTTGPTTTTAATVKVGRNGSVATYYHASSGTVYFGHNTGTSSITFASYSTANNNTCAGYYW